MTGTYRDIKADILRQITRGALTPGSQIAGEVELAEHYGVTRVTVNRALRELAAEGIIERRRKSGTRVRLSPLRQARFDIPVVRHEVEERGAAYSHAVLSRREVPAPGWLAAQIGLAANAPVLHLTCLHHADGAPYQHEDRWINLGQLPQARGVDFADLGPTEWLIAQIPFSEVEVGLTAEAADAELAACMGCAPGTPLLQMERATRWEGQPVTFVRLSHHPGYRMTTRY